MSYPILLAAAIAVIIIGFVVRRRSEAVGKILMVIGAIICLVGFGWQMRQTVFAPDAGPDRGQAVVAYFLANQVIGDVGDKQGSVALIFPPESVMDAETVGTYSGTFARVARGFSNLQLQTVTLEVSSKEAKTGRIPQAAFQSATRQINNVVAYVSFAGVPPDIEQFAPGGAKPAFYAFDPWRSTNWLEGFKKGLVRAVVVPRPGVSSNDGEVSGEPQAVFNQLYLMATPATAEQVAGQLKTK